jgi:hypothetical protein
MELPDIAQALSEKWQTEYNPDTLPEFRNDRHTEELLAVLALVSCTGVLQAFSYAEKHLGHVLTRDRLDRSMLRALLHRPMIDNSLIDLQKLATLRVPAMGGSIDALVKIRKSDDDFRKWREHLKEALRDVGSLTEDTSSLKEASEIVTTHLSDGLNNIEKAVNKSPALQAAKAGLTGLVISGISGTTTEVMTGDPLVGVTAGAMGGAAAGFLDAGFSYIKALQERRRGQLIMDVSMLFDPQYPADN